MRQNGGARRVYVISRTVLRYRFIFLKSHRAICDLLNYRQRLNADLHCCELRTQIDDQCKPLALRSFQDAF